MKIKLFFSLALILFNFTYAQNCVVVDQTNIATINNIIINLSANGGGCIEIKHGDYYNVPAISLKSDIVLKVYGNLYRDYNIISVVNCKNVSIIGDNIGSLNYSSPAINQTAKGIEVKNSRNISIEGMTINNFADKGILVRGINTTDVIVRNNNIMGANGTHGVAIAVSDDSDGNVTFCSIESNTVFNNRIGISVNKSRYINITGNHTYLNNLYGIGLDGVASLSGDGSQYCNISNNQVYNNGGICESAEAKAGIYLGNASQKNIISNNIIKSNSCYGIFYYQEPNNDSIAYNNTFTNNQIVNNDRWGIRIANSHRSIISNNQIIENGEGGIQLNQSNANLITSNNIILNGTAGINLNNCQDNILPSGTNVFAGQTNEIIVN